MVEVEVVIRKEGLVERGEDRAYRYSLEGRFWIADTVGDEEEVLDSFRKLVLCTLVCQTDVLFVLQDMWAWMSGILNSYGSKLVLIIWLFEGLSAIGIVNDHDSAVEY